MGKTKTLETLQADPRFVVYPEPIEKWVNFSGKNLLQSFYQASEETKGDVLFRLQVLIASTLCKRTSEAEAFLESHGDKVAVMERSISSSFMFLRANKTIINSLDYEIIVDLLETLSSIHNQSALNICLTTDINTVLARLCGRGRKGEDNIDVQYLVQLNRMMDEEARARSWAIIDTTSLTPEEVAERIIKLVF